ncbi:hypothetical protein [Natrarchaeobaculum sulfurireducens]|nr:hypothetical protein [Natrarchaeobaculum sulfurireducens]
MTPTRANEPHPDVQRFLDLYESLEAAHDVYERIEADLRAALE